jgi:hypothetical protein
VEAFFAVHAGLSDQPFTRERIIKLAQQSSSKAGSFCTPNMTLGKLQGTLYERVYSLKQIQQMFNMTEISHNP